MATATMTTQAAPGWAPENKQQTTVEEDFMHGVNVASCHLKVRMGKQSDCAWLATFELQLIVRWAGFLRKVYGILCVQLLFTCALAALFMSVESIKTFVQTRLAATFFIAPSSITHARSPTLFLAAQFVGIGVLVALIINRHKHPLNLQLLGAFVSLHHTTFEWQPHRLARHFARRISLGRL